MTPQELKTRIRTYAVRCLKLVASFPRNQSGSVVGYQLTKAATSSAANYWSACRARSHKDFVNKLGIVEEELDESMFWVDFAPDAGLTTRELVQPLLCEANELLAIVSASHQTAKIREAAKTRPR
jgi:four helix bundle protein